MMDVAATEIELYRWYQSRRETHYGWIPNMFHSLTQQLVSQDFELYRLTVHLRADLQWKLMSFPSQVQDIQEGQLMAGRLPGSPEKMLRITTFLDRLVSPFGRYDATATVLTVPEDLPMPEYRCVNAARVVHSAFVSVSDDHKKIETGRTWDGLAALHRDLTAPIPAPKSLQT